MTTYSLTQYVPIRLSPNDRSKLQILHSALLVSEYTDNIDITSRRNKAMRILTEIEEACATACGLGVAFGGPGSRGIAKNSLTDNADFLRDCFEVGRRNKILNPSKMRDTYGKMMYLLQDSLQSNVARSMGFSLYKEIVTVRAFLEDFLGEEKTESLVNDDLFEEAVKAVKESDAQGTKIPRDVVVEMVRRKNAAREAVLKKYSDDSSDTADASGASPPDSSGASPPPLTAAALALALDSMSDAKTVINQNVEPVEKMLFLLEDNFNANKESGFSLALDGGYSSNSFGRSFRNYSYTSGFMGGGGGGASGGSGGAKLSHSHPTQYVRPSEESERRE